MKSIRIGNDIRIEWPIVLSGDVSKLQDLDLTVEVRPSRNVVDWHNYIEQPTLYRGKQTVMMNGGMEFRPDMGDGKEHCISHRPKPPVPPVKLPYHIENNTLIAMWTADRQFAVGDYDIIVYAHKNGGGQAVADTYRFVRLVPHTAQADGPDNSGIEAVITMQPLTLCLSGLSAYEVAVVNGFQGSVEEWLESLKAGKLSSFVSVESIDNLPQQGDESTGYIIGTKLYIYVGTGGDTLEGKYKDVGEFRGPQGAPGSNGKSAYELAVEGGYEGSVEEWLLSLKGRDGVDGVNGKDGLDGETVIDTFACWTKPEQVITLTVPENAYYFGLSGVTSRKSKFYLNIEDDFEAEITQNAKDISAIKTQIGSLGGNPFAGKKLVVSGDSIAYGAGNEGKGYGGIIAEMYGMTFVNNGVSGTTMRVVPDHTSIPLLFKGWKDNEIRGWGDADYILLEGGYNDIYYTDQNLPEEGDWLGTFDENYELSMSADNANVSDVIPNTFYARLDFYLSYVSRYAKKDAKIIYVIAWKQNNANKLVDENTEGSQGDWMKVYNAIHKCCKKYGIPIVDMWGESRAIATLNPYKQYTNNQDGVHPTDEGYRLYWVNPIVAKMRDI